MIMNQIWDQTSGNYSCHGIIMIIMLASIFIIPINVLIFSSKKPPWRWWLIPQLGAADFLKYSHNLSQAEHKKSFESNFCNRLSAGKLTDLAGGELTVSQHLSSKFNFIFIFILLGASWQMAVSQHLSSKFKFIFIFYHHIAGDELIVSQRLSSKFKFIFIFYHHIAGDELIVSQHLSLKFNFIFNCWGRVDGEPAVVIKI